ncbi:MAG TPA: terminase family protein [Stellaceae bacterium]|nr:terminase family protein [Stellaceae bacterium]
MAGEAEGLAVPAPSFAPSLAARFAALPVADRTSALAELSDEEVEGLSHDWRFWARPSQLPPEGQWRVWLLLAGRGFGKTRSGAEWVRMLVEQRRARRVALVAPTAADARDVMVEGESGLLAVAPPDFRPLYEPSKRRLTWPNGAIATCFSADEPERLRGPQHDAAWCDELAAWRYAEAWDMLLLGLRLGSDPRVVATTTPKPTRLVRALIAAEGTFVTRGATRENLRNLAPQFLAEIVKRYEGTRLGRQELEAEILEDAPGALWRRDALEGERRKPGEVPSLRRIVVAIDPASSSAEGADETGIIVAGLGEDGHGYVLDDRSGRYAPERWAKEAVALYRKRAADRIVAEVNNGGDMVQSVLRTVDASASFKAVHASRGKVVRAEPVAALYEQGRVHHVGCFPALEDQLCGFTAGFDRRRAGSSPDRLDALVWALTELMVEDSGQAWLDYYGELARKQG